MTLCTNTGIESFFVSCFVYYTWLEASQSAHHLLPRPILACGTLVPVSLSKCINQLVFFRAVGQPCREQLIWVSHDEAAPLIDVHNELVHCSAERCKLHRPCFGRLTVTHSVNEKLNSKLIITFSTRARKCFFCHSECEHLEVRACCTLLQQGVQITQGSLVTVLRRGGQNYIRLQHVSLGCCLPNFITTSNVSQS